MKSCTSLKIVARQASTSYGPIGPSRVREILLGETPTELESIRLYQGLTECGLDELVRLAAELGLPFDALKARFHELYQKEMEQAQQWKFGTR